MKKWTIGVLCSLFSALALCAGLVFAVDPCFHYRAPTRGLSYRFGDDSCVSPGILRFFGGDAVITGTSVASNFLCGEADALFGVRSVRAIFRNGRGADFAALFKMAEEFDIRPKAVVWGIDPESYILHGAQEHRVAAHPGFLYDKNSLNDFSYLLNRFSLADSVRTLLQTALGAPGETMEDYTAWGDKFEFGKALAITGYERPEKAEGKAGPEPYLRLAAEQFERNVEPALRAFPDTEFYIFSPPYSMLYWDGQARQGRLEAVVTAYFYLLGRVLEYDNARVFPFLAAEEIITDLDLYTDAIHFSPEVNSLLLRSMAEGAHEATAETLLQIRDGLLEFLRGYDYDALFK